MSGERLGIRRRFKQVREKVAHYRSPEQKIARALREIARPLAFSDSWPATEKRLDAFTDKFQSPLEGPQQYIGLQIVEALEEHYEPNLENTLERTAALIVRRRDFLERVGITDNRAIFGMLRRATLHEVNRNRIPAKEESDQLLGFDGQPVDIYHLQRVNELLQLQGRLTDFGTRHFSVVRDQSML